MAYHTSESNAERSFLYYWTILNTLGIEPTSEHRFDDTRKWRFDFAFIAPMIAVEIEGGLYMNGRHVQAKGYQADCYKYNRAVELGWRVLRYSPQMLKNDPVTIIQQIERTIRG